MNRMQFHTLAFTMCVASMLAAGFTPLSAPTWIRWVGVALALPAIVMFIVTAPRTQR